VEVRCDTVAVTVPAAQRRLRARLLLAASAATALGTVASSCSGTDDAAAGPKPSTSASPSDQAAQPPAAQLAARATLAQDQYYSASFRYAPSDGSAPGTGRVERTRTGFRLDLTQPGDAASVGHTTAVVQTGAATFTCRLTAAARGCVAGASAGTPDAAAVDRIRLAFTDWLSTLADPAAAISVAEAPLPPGAQGACFSVEGVAASLEPPVDPGVYCFDGVGKITVLKLAVGAITITEVAPAPPTVAMPAPVVAALPPIAAPSPTPSATPPNSTQGPSSQGNASPTVRHSPK
jgi:hypothetical protein